MLIYDIIIDNINVVLPDFNTMYVSYKVDSERSFGQNYSVTISTVKESFEELSQLLGYFLFLKNTRKMVRVNRSACVPLGLLCCFVNLKAIKLDYDAAIIWDKYVEEFL